MEDVRITQPSISRPAESKQSPDHVLDGRYRLTRLIAVGGMARVYTAHDERLDRTVAVKILNSQHINNRQFMKAFSQEARTTARLWHPNIVAIFDRGVYCGLPYLVMEYVPGRTLRTILTTQNNLPAIRAMRLCRQILAALTAAHHAGIVHRDIKPENILVTHCDGVEIVKVADFGLAQAMRINTNTVARSRDTLLLATVAYLAPELITTGKADGRADVYSTGVLLYELLVGDVPFDGHDPVMVAHMHVNNDVPHISSVDFSFSVPVSDLVAKATRRKIDERFCDTTAFALELDSVIAELSATATNQPRTKKAALHESRNTRKPVHSLMTTRFKITCAIIAIAILVITGWWLVHGD